jgi:hypothetical protein
MSCPLQVRVTPEEPGCVCTWLRGCASAGRVCVFIRVAVDSCVCVPHDNGARARARTLSLPWGTHATCVQRHCDAARARADPL